MKVVIITVDDAKKTELAGAEKLAKTDLLVLVSTKTKSDMPKAVSDIIDELACQTEYCKIDAASETDAAYAYYAGYHEAKGHDTFIVATDKAKVTKLTAKAAKVYTSFKSIVSGDSASGKKTASSAKKTSSSKKTSSGKKTSSKKTSKKDENKTLGDTLSQLVNSKETKKLINVAKKALKDANK